MNEKNSPPVALMADRLSARVDNSSNHVAVRSMGTFRRQVVEMETNFLPSNNVIFHASSFTRSIGCEASIVSGRIQSVTKISLLMGFVFCLVPSATVTSAHGKEKRPNLLGGAKSTHMKTRAQTKPSVPRKARPRRAASVIYPGPPLSLMDHPERPATHPVNPFLRWRETDYLGETKNIAIPRRRAMDVGFTVRKGRAYYQGDIILGPSKGIGNRLRQQAQDQRKIKSSLRIYSHVEYLWPNGELPYVIDSSLSSSESTVADIKAAVLNLNQTTNLSIVPWTGEINYLKLVAGDGCASWVGMQGGMQEITIVPRGGVSHRRCTVGDIKHQFLHAAGLWHAHSRAGGHRHVTLYTSKMDPSAQPNFRPPGSNFLDGWWFRSRRIGAYDLRSIMHFSSASFARDYWRCAGSDGLGGLLSECPLLTKLGEYIAPVEELSENDIRIVRQMYPVKRSAPAVAKTTSSAQSGASYLSESETIDSADESQLKRHCPSAIKRLCRGAPSMRRCLEHALKTAKSSAEREALLDGPQCRDLLPDNAP